jgi:two-component system phosphate regulon response regulator PhoB
MSTILLVEDNETLGNSLSQRLGQEGYEVTWAVSIADCLKKIEQQTINLAIVDVGLPDGDGFELARKHLKVLKIPFIFLTAMNSAEDRLEGYELGGDDYIPKPFHLKELLLRVRKVMERYGDGDKLFLKEFTLDVAALAISFPDGRTEPLQASDFKMLRMLIESAPRIVSREEIRREVWQDESSTSRAVDNSMVRLRQILGEELGKCIHSARGVGYQWIPRT